MKPALRKVSVSALTGEAQVLRSPDGRQCTSWPSTLHSV